MSSLRLKQVSTKLRLLSLGSLFLILLLVSLLLTAAFQDFTRLRNFQQVSSLASIAADLSSRWTEERQACYNASGFLGDAPPAQQLEQLQARIQASSQPLAQLSALASQHTDSFSPAFLQGLQKVLEAAKTLEPLHAEVLDKSRPQQRDEGSKLKTRTLAAYDAAQAQQSNLLPLLCTEASDAELARRITTLDNLARLQRDLWKTKGLVGTALRNRKTTDSAGGEIKSRLLAIDDHIARIRVLVDSSTASAVNALLQSQEFQQLLALSARARDLAGKSDDFKDLPAFNDYQSGLSAAIEPLFARVVETGNQQLAAYTASRLAEARNRLLLYGSLCAISILGLLTLLVLITRSITAPLNRVTRDLHETAASASDATDVIAGSAHQLSLDSAEQAASVQEISASMEELSAMNASTLQQVRQISSNADLALRATETGSANMQRLSTDMDQVRKSTADIAGIIKIIDEISFQTNILALNAAVEAARAGESGAGFAVVADEVRSLAQRSATAARESASKIDNAVRNTASANELAAQTATAFAEINRLTKGYNDIVRSLEAATTQGNESFAHVKEAIAKVDGITQRSAAAAEQNASSSQETKAVVSNLKQSIRLLEDMVSHER